MDNKIALFQSVSSMAIGTTMRLTKWRSVGQAGKEHDCNTEKSRERSHSYPIFGVCYALAMGFDPWGEALLQKTQPFMFSRRGLKAKILVHIHSDPRILMHFLRRTL